jgi:nucleotide-binding universal stress UspA family protein
MNTYRIVVGVDGSDDGNRALEWACREAERRGGTVQAVTAWTWDGIEGAVVARTNPSDERARAEQALTSAVGGVRTLYPDVIIASEAIEGAPARVLTHAAQDADMLVLGSHGHSRLYHAILGSVAHECIRAATCPVLIVPVPHAERVPKPAEVRQATRA